MTDQPSSTDQDVGFWADQCAEDILHREITEPIVIKGGVSPSGVPHLGHQNEILRGYFVAESLRSQDYAVQQVFTSDDRDRLRAIPRKLADLNWNIVGLDEIDAEALGKNLGKPLTSIPDPFGCCDSFGDHQTELLIQSADLVDVPIEVISATSMYESGALEDITATILSKQELARDILANYQDKVDASYVPFLAICQECGHLTEDILNVDIENRRVTYKCSNVEAGNQIIEGCGHSGTATFREGKLPWRFEWPAQWQALNVDFEPFGKDHAEGSWPSGKEIASRLLDFQPPVPMTYEWFTLNGEPLSSSAGNIITISQVLSFLELEVLRYFFALSPKKSRDFDIETLDQLVDDFDRLESIYFNEIEDEDLKPFANGAYPYLVDEIREDRVRLPYTFAAVLGMTDDRELRLQMARNEGHIDENTPEWAIDNALKRVEKAHRWAQYVDNEYNYRLQENLPDISIDTETAQALDELADFIAKGHSGEEIQSEIYETAKRHSIDVPEFFATGYKLFLGQDSGPKLGPFLAALDDRFVVERLRRNE
ncbi:MAG: lysine--tRNA ligase [Halobacteriaceae archaeon]